MDDISLALNIAKKLKETLIELDLPPQEGYKSNSQHVIDNSFVKNTRGYIEKIVNQINGCYEQGWFDGCAVLIRRLIETLIIEVYEKYQISDKIQDPNTKEFFFLKEMVKIMKSEATFNIGRNVKRSLENIKEIGDKAAHSRRYNAHRIDIDNLKTDIRDTVQELLSLAQII